MSESEQKGPCWSEVDECRGSPSELKIAGAIDRLAADVAAVMEMTREIALRVPSEFGQDACDVAVRVALKERDAAVRERDEARALLELAQVQRTAAYADRDEARAEVYQVKCSRTETSKERDAAIRERDQWREEARLAVINRDEARAEAERLKAELAARQAADVQPIGWIARHNHAPPVGKYVMCRWDVEARQGYARQVSYGAAKRGPDGMWRSPTGVEKIAPVHWMPLPPGVEGGDEWEQQTTTAPHPAGQGISPKVADTQPTGNAAPAPGWLTERERHVLSSMLSERPCDSSLHWTDDVQPVFRSILSRAGSPPSQTVPWWLTADERSVLKSHAKSLREQRFSLERGGQTLGYSANSGSLKREADIIEALLARAGSPPVVEVPAMRLHGQRRPDSMTIREVQLAQAYRDALDKAGVPWKEVGRE